MSPHLVIANPATVELAPLVLDAPPQARATSIARSQDCATTVIAWSCTKGRFRWRHHVDERAHILAGEVFITDQSGSERRLGPGDVAFFPAGSASLWQVTADVRTIAVCQVAVPGFVALGLRAWNQLRGIAADMLGLNGEISAAPRA